jgi:hypothetical protein
MTVNLNEVAIALTHVEGLASNQNVTDTKEFLAVLGLRWRAMPAGPELGLLNPNW